MVQVIGQGRVKPPTAMQRLGMGLSGAMNQYVQHAQEEKALSEEDAAIQNQLGINLKGIRGKNREQALASELAGKRELALEGFKQQGKRTEENNKLLQNRQIISDLEKKRGLEPGSLSAYENNPKMAEQISRPEKPAKEPRKTQASQPIDPEQLDKIQEVRNKPGFSEASPSKKYQMFTDNGVSKENAKAESDIYAEEEKIKTEKGKAKAKKTEAQKKQEFNEKLRVHKESEDYDKEILSKSRVAKRTLENVKEARNAMKSGKVKPTSVVNILSFFGDVGKTLANAIQSGDHAAVRALMPEFLEGKKELFGIRLSDADLRLLQDKSIDISKSPEANKSILRLIEKYADQSILRGDIASELSKKNKGYRPLGYERMVDEEFDRQMNPIEMTDSRGNFYTIPAYRVGSAIKKGLSVRNE